MELHMCTYKRNILFATTMEPQKTSQSWPPTHRNTASCGPAIHHSNSLLSASHTKVWKFETELAENPEIEVDAQ